MRLLLLKLALLALFNTAYAQVELAPIPEWVSRIETGSEKAITNAAGLRYLLIDQQYHLPNSTVFYQYKYQVSSADAIQENSDVRVVFDPSFQQLVLHQIGLIRNGKTIDQLSKDRIELIRRETGSDRALYDGNLTALVHLKDVRKDDVVVYCYSITGFNPAHSGHFFAHLYHGYTTPIDQIHYRVIVDESLPIHYRTLNHQSKPKVSGQGTLREYTWKEHDVPAVTYDDNLSPWEMIFPVTSISTHKSWAEVVEWALPLFAYQSVPNLDIDRSGRSKLGIINELINTVQDDVRYLGLEGGISAYRPNPPVKVWQQRFGDCKDKSLLLSALLRREGVEAYPMLVNTEYRKNTAKFQPSPIAFDHCVVMYEFEGENYFVDPTFSDQRGELSGRYFPDYGVGLPVKPGDKELITLPTPQLSEVHIQESYNVHEIGGNASLRVETTYSGRKADDMRSYFLNNSREYIQREYKNFYNSLYQGIEEEFELEFSEKAEGGENAFTTIEYYNIPNFWEVGTNEDIQVAKVYPLVLESMTKYAKTPERTYAYHLGAPFHYLQESVIHLPEDWNVTPEEKRVERDEITYISNVRGEYDKVYISYAFTQHLDEVDAKNAPSFIKDFQTVKDDWMFQLTYKPNLTGFKVDMLALFAALLIGGAGLFAGWKIYTGFDPPAWQYAENKGIGGWLILPAIGMTITPVRILHDLINTGIFNQITWINLSQQGAKLVLIYTLIFNISLLVFALIVLTHFYARRTSLPMLISIFYLVNFVFVAADHFLAVYLLQVSSADMGYRAIANALVAAAIWIPYFMYSERVKSTFCKTYG